MVETRPVIALEPEVISVPLGQTASFTVIANGIPEPTFTWLKNGVAIANKTDSTLTLSNVTALSAANYSVLVKNAAGTVISSVAR